MMTTVSVHCSRNDDDGNDNGDDDDDDDDNDDGDDVDEPEHPSQRKAISPPSIESQIIRGR